MQSDCKNGVNLGLFITNLPDESNMLDRKNGNVIFTDVSPSSGILNKAQVKLVGEPNCLTMIMMANAFGHIELVNEQWIS